jgi:aminomethyltransferase
MVSARLKRTPLFDQHMALKAKMAPFGGWEMPIQYAGIIAEVRHTRNAVTIFDTCHMGEFLVKGDCLKSGLDRLLTQKLKSMPIGSCRYGFMLNNNGGIIDDLIAYRLQDDEWMMVVNAGKIPDEAAHVKANLSEESSFEDLSDSLGKIDVQGPGSLEVMGRLFGADVGKLAFYRFDMFQILGESMIVSRTGYTGEVGFEIYCPSALITDLWKMLMEEKDVKPAGLGSRDILRLEMGYDLYGMDLDESTTPLEAGLARYVDFDKDFIGKDALAARKKEGVKRARAFFMASSRRAPRHEYEIYAGGKRVGAVTSGTFSPSLEKGIGMGFVDPGYENPGTAISIRSGGNEIEAVMAGKPFYKK